MKRLKKSLLILFMAITAASLLGLAFSKTVKIKASTSDGKKILVSLGDSYSCGEGIEPFYGQDKPSAEKVLDEDWIAHRSEKVWSSLLTINGQKMIRNVNWFFVASSGARTYHLTEPQEREYDYDGFKGKTNITPQLNIFDEVNKKYGTGAVDFVTLQIGGNDIGFVDLMTNAILTPDALDEELETIKYNFNNPQIVTEGNEKIEKSPIRDNIKNAYKQVAEKAGKQATIIVAGYPRIMNPKGFTVAFILSISEETAKKINDAVDYFNNELEKIVDECRSEGINIYFVSVTEAFTGHEAGTADPYINDVQIGKGDQDIKGNFITPSAASLHPNEAGTAVYAKLIQAEIDKHLSNTATKPTLKLSTKKGTVKLKWAKVEGATNYRVYRYINGKAKLIKKTKKNSYNFKNSVSGVKYTFSVKAYVNGKWVESDKKSIKSK